MPDARHRIFIHEYVTDFNGARAYVAAGFSPESAAQGASRLLKKPAIQKAIVYLLERRCREMCITKDRVLRETALLAFSNMEDYIEVSGRDVVVDLSKLDRDHAAPIQELTIEEYTEGKGETALGVKRTKFKLADKRAALELLGKHLALFRDRVEHTGLNGGPIEHTIRFGDGVNDDKAK